MSVTAIISFLLLAMAPGLGMSDSEPFPLGTKSAEPAPRARVAGMLRDSRTSARSVTLSQKSRVAQPAMANGTRLRHGIRPQSGRVAAEKACRCGLYDRVAPARRRSRSCARTARQV